MQDVVASQSFLPNSSEARVETDVTACFSVQAVADPSVMPRVLELFAKRGLIPARWHSDLGGRPDRLPARPYGGHPARHGLRHVGSGIGKALLLIHPPAERSAGERISALSESLQRL